MYSLLNGKKIIVRIGSNLARVLSSLDTGCTYIGMSTEMLILSTLIVTSKAIDSMPFTPNIESIDKSKIDGNVACLGVHHVNSIIKSIDSLVYPNVYVGSSKFIDYYDSISFDDVITMNVNLSIPAMYITNELVDTLKMACVVLNNVNMNANIKFDGVVNSNARLVDIILTNATISDAFKTKVLIGFCSYLRIRLGIKTRSDGEMNVDYIDADPFGVYLNEVISSSSVVLSDVSNPLDYNCEITINQMCTVDMIYDSSLLSISEFKLSELDDLTLEEIISNRM